MENRKSANFKGFTKNLILFRKKIINWFDWEIRQKSQQVYVAVIT